jgi:arylsulfatase A-like enzyme
MTTEGVWSRRVTDAAAVLVAWAALLLAENVAVGFLWREQFSGAWEIALSRRAVFPSAVVALAPASVALALAWEQARRAGQGSVASLRGLALAGALAAAALAVGISQGRHFSSLWLRIPFVAGMTLGGAVVGGRGSALAARLERRPAALTVAALCAGMASWAVDAFVLTRLYAAFHAALFAACLAAWAVAGIVARTAFTQGRPGPRWLAPAAAIAVVACAALAPGGVRHLGRLANVRIALVEHAPVEGRAVAALVRLWPPAATERPTETAGAAPAGEIPRSLDWSGSDILLLSVDALRADHVSAYGYGRPTTPNIDALAAEGTLFEAAYCPTPHTSYSVSSMMTGKYLRPLLSLHAGGDSETWPQYLRRYGYLTAAFYPPAVFFIDENRFERFEHDKLGFEYAKVEFAAPALRETQVAAYLDGAAPDRPLFLWVHFFEPHEPYEAHADHVFSGGERDVDAYDGEVATADEGIGRVVRLVRARRQRVAVVVTADHGEEFGEHGGRYHGTSVYEEQVRVPLVVVGPGVHKGGKAATVAQTIDLLPTVLSALGIPRPARVRGRDLGPALAGGPGAAEAGFAFAETDEATLVASGEDRLVCERRAAACALYRPRVDPRERHDVASADPAAFERLRGLLRATERDHGRYEGRGATAWPEALRRGAQGEVDAAPDVASLLDDADVGIRRAAAEVSFGLHVAATAPSLRRALARDEDDLVRRWCALALLRAGEPAPPAAEALLTDAARDWRRRAALAFAEGGDPRGCDEMAAWWNDVAPPSAQRNDDGEPPSLRMDLLHARELLEATGKARCRAAVDGLLRALADVRARPFVADALGAVGDKRAAAPLLAALAVEQYVTTRPHEVRALLALGVRPPEEADRDAGPRDEGARGGRGAAISAGP